MLCCLANIVRILTTSIESLLKIVRMLFTILMNKPNRFPVLMKLSACLSKWAAHEPLRSGSHSQQVVTGPLAFLAKTYTFKLQRVHFTQQCVCVCVCVFTPMTIDEIPESVIYQIMVRKGKLRAAKWTHDCSHFIFTSLMAKK